MHEEIGTVKWFGDSTKQSPGSDYGYITRNENPGTDDIKVYWKRLKCSVDDIKWQKGLLVYFRIGNYKGKEEAIDVYPVQVAGYIEKLTPGYSGYKVVVDSSLVEKRVQEILLVNKQELKEQNIYNQQEVSAKNFYQSIPVDKKQLICPESNLTHNCAVSFQIKKNHKNEYQAVKVSLIEDENLLPVLENHVHSENRIVSLTAFRRYLSIVSDEEAIKFVQTKINNIHILKIPISKDIFVNKILYSDGAKPLRDILHLNERLQICLERFADSEEATNKEVLDELLGVVKEVEKSGNSALWKKIPKSLIFSKITYKGFIFEFIPDFLKYKVVAKYLETKPDVEAAKIADDTFESLKDNNQRKDFVSLISDKLKSRLDAYHFRQLISVESKLSIYQNMINIYTIDELVKHKIEDEIISTLCSLPVHQKELWLNKVESKIVYKGFLWQIAPVEIKKRLIKAKFAHFSNAIEIFQKGYPYQQNITASAKDIYSAINEKDKELAQTWISNTKHYEQVFAKMLSARGAERFAIEVYKSFGFQVEDVSIMQLNKQGDWQTHDLLLNKKISVDIKNARQAGYTLKRDFKNKYKYSEFCVPKFKLNRSNNEVIIAGVFSPYLKLESIISPAQVNFEIPYLTFIGEVKESELKTLEEHFSNYFDAITIPRSSKEKYLPPWLFDYPADTFYTQQEQAITQLRELTLSEFPDWDDVQILNIKPFPLCLAAKVNLPNSWKTCLTMWEEVFISRLQKIPTSKVTLPYLFLTILAHFIDMLGRNDKSFHPSKYNSLLYSGNSQVHPLGIYDPLDTIKELYETLSLLWDNTYNNQSLISQFRLFKFDARGLLKGQRNMEDSLKTILAYCGGYIEEKGYCGFSPLIYGKEITCSKCGYLICNECKYCNCKQRKNSFII